MKEESKSHQSELVSPKEYPDAYLLDVDGQVISKGSVYVQPLAKSLTYQPVEQNALGRLQKDAATLILSDGLPRIAVAEARICSDPTCYHLHILPAVHPSRNP